MAIWQHRSCKTQTKFRNNVRERQFDLPAKVGRDHHPVDARRQPRNNHAGQTVITTAEFLHYRSRAQLWATHATP